MKLYSRRARHKTGNTKEKHASKQKGVM